MQSLCGDIALLPQYDAIHPAADIDVGVGSFLLQPVPRGAVQILPNTFQYKSVPKHLRTVVIGDQQKIQIRMSVYIAAGDRAVYGDQR